MSWVQVGHSLGEALSQPLGALLLLVLPFAISGGAAATHYCLRRRARSRWSALRLAAFAYGGAVLPLALGSAGAVADLLRATPLAWWGGLVADVVFPLTAALLGIKSSYNNSWVESIGDTLFFACITALAVFGIVFFWSNVF